MKENQVEWRDYAEAERATGNTELFNWFANGCNRRQQEIEAIEEEINKRLGY